MIFNVSFETSLTDPLFWQEFVEILANDDDD